MQGLIIILIALALLYLLVVFGWRKFMKGTWSKADQSFFEKNWTRIKAEQDLRMRVMEADKLLDSMTKKKGMTGSMGEKLKRNAKSFSDVDALWKAHKMRNRLAHEMEIRISGVQANDALRAFGKAFRDLGLIE